MLYNSCYSSNNRFRVLRTLCLKTQRDEINKPRTREVGTDIQKFTKFFDRRKIIDHRWKVMLNFFFSFFWIIYKILYEYRISHFNWKRERRTHWLISESRFADRFRAQLMPPQIITADFNVNERKAEAWPDTGIYSPDDLCGIALTASLPVPRNIKNILNDSYKILL